MRLLGPLIILRFPPGGLGNVLGCQVDLEKAVGWVAALACARVVAPRGGILLAPGGLDDAAVGTDTTLRRAASDWEFEVEEVAESNL